MDKNTKSKLSILNSMLKANWSNKYYNMYGIIIIRAYIL